MLQFARHEVCARSGQQLAIGQHRAGGVRHVRQCGDRAVGFGFLRIARRTVQDDDQCDHDHVSRQPCLPSTSHAASAIATAASKW